MKEGLKGKNKRKLNKEKLRGRKREEERRRWEENGKLKEENITERK